MSRRLLPYGDRAVLVEVDTLDDVMALHHALAEDPLPGVRDLVPAACSVTVVVDPSVLAPERAGRWALACPASAPDVDDADEVVLEVSYDGADLADVASALGLSEREVVEVHTGSTWRVAFTGFAPGFGYLVTDHDRLHVPRRDRPRTAVPAGAVGLAGEFSGIYPRGGPGGWRLIGRTAATLWDPESSPPALLTPGRLVRFREAP